ncbi:hypothetical protein JTB14_027726 [Gonioctena quinquepunctata]|nr:hypothetical protein JTB14_027726 [Gonioctena quinquepunctata]
MDAFDDLEHPPPSVKRGKTVGCPKDSRRRPSPQPYGPFSRLNDGAASKASWPTSTRCRAAVALDGVGPSAQTSSSETPVSISQGADWTFWRTFSVSASVKYTNIEELAQDVLANMRSRVENICQRLSVQS